MKAFTCSYGPVYGRLAQVLRKSIKRHSPGVEPVHRKMMAAPPVAGVAEHATINTGKLWTWHEYVMQAEDDVVCMDADMICLGDLTEAFETGTTIATESTENTEDGECDVPTASSLQPTACCRGDVPTDSGLQPTACRQFDVAYTVRPGMRRYQGGAVFIRNTEAAQRWMTAWVVLNDSLLDDPDRLEALIHDEGGCNQAALSLLIQDPLEDVVTAELPCAVWNCCYQTWGSFGPETRLLHLTGRLRRAVLEGRRPDPVGPYGDLIPMVDAWLAEMR